MLLTMLKAKIHRARVTRCDLEYEGSVTIDTVLLNAAGILPYEQIDVFNINNGMRFTSYAIEGERGSGVIGINGAAARLAHPGDVLIICAYTCVEAEEARDCRPVVVQVDPDNTISAASPR